MKVLKIDPFKKEVSEADIPPTLQDFYEAMNCDMMERISNGKSWLWILRTIYMWLRRAVMKLPSNAVHTIAIGAFLFIY
jgi:hypothetical protein